MGGHILAMSSITRALKLWMTVLFRGHGLYPKLFPGDTIHGMTSHEVTSLLLNSRLSLADPRLIGTRRFIESACINNQ